MTSRKHTLQSRVLEHCRVTGTFDDRVHALVAVSGGADSMVLLDCLAAGRNALEIEITVAHVDHGLRESSASDAEFVLEGAAGRGLKALVRQADVRGMARRQKLSMEDAARRVRYAALKEMAAEAGADAIATGHTATDQAETLLMRMVRGTGPLGLGGIDPVRPDGLVRPLLCATRDEVRSYASEHGIGFRDDPTNLDRRFLRNRVRLDLLPILVEMNPRVEFTLSELAGSAGELASWIDRVAAQLVSAKGPTVAGISKKDVEACDPAMLPYAIRIAFRMVTGLHLGLSRTHLDAVARLARAGKGRGEYHLPEGVTAMKDRTGLWLTLDHGGARRRTRSAASGTG